MLGLSPCVKGRRGVCDGLVSAQSSGGGGQGPHGAQTLTRPQALSAAGLCPLRTWRLHTCGEAATLTPGVLHKEAFKCGSRTTRRVRQALKSQREEAFSESEGDPVQEEARDTVLAQSRSRLTDEPPVGTQGRHPGGTGTQEGRAPVPPAAFRRRSPAFPFCTGSGYPLAECVRTPAWNELPRGGPST